MNATNEQKLKMSEQISAFCSMVESVRLDYIWNQDEVQRCEKLTQDYLHKLELGNLNYKERAKIATQLSECRQQRRQSKDTVEILEAFAHFIESEKGKTMINLMQEALGKTRKAEQLMENRSYRFRVLDEKPIYAKPKTPPKQKATSTTQSQPKPKPAPTEQKANPSPQKSETAKPAPPKEEPPPINPQTKPIQDLSHEAITAIIGKSKQKSRGRRKGKKKKHK